MKGFKVKFNDADPSNFAVIEGVVILAISYQFGVSITGGDDTQGVSLKWQGFPLAIGDKVRIIPEESLYTETAMERVLKQDLEEEYYALEQILMERRSSK